MSMDRRGVCALLVDIGGLSIERGSEFMSNGRAYVRFFCTCESHKDVTKPDLNSSLTAGVGTLSGHIYFPLLDIGLFFESSKWLLNAKPES